jgi:hypothetical protein
MVLNRLHTLMEVHNLITTVPHSYIIEQLYPVVRTRLLGSRRTNLNMNRVHLHQIMYHNNHRHVKTVHDIVFPRRHRVLCPS